MDEEQKHYLNEFFTRYLEPHFRQDSPQLMVQQG